MDHFRGIILDGHKGAAVPVPFDPAERWGLPARALWRGRRGHRVSGRLAGKAFESAIVGRQRRFYVLVDEELLARARVRVGDTVEVEVQPLGEPAAPSRTAARPARPRARRRARGAGR